MARIPVVFKYNVGDTVKVKLEYANLHLSGFAGKSNIVKITKRSRRQNQPRYQFENIDMAGTPMSFGEDWIECLVKAGCN